MEKSVPVNVWGIARRLGVHVMEGDFQDKNTSGMMIDSQEIISPFQTQRAIIINRSDQDEVQAFTIADELGHFILHKKRDLFRGVSFFAYFNGKKSLIQ